MKKRRIRIKDIARASGLSTATIDRVLNDRSGVRSQTRDQVHEALRNLGYSPELLRARSVLPGQNIEVLLSDGTNPFFAQIRAGFDAALAPFAHSDLRIVKDGFDPYVPARLADRLARVAPDTNVVITVGVDNPDVVDAINALVDRDVRVVTVVSDVPGSRRSAFVGQDNFLAGRTAARLMTEILREDRGDVAMLLGHLQFRHLLDRQAGFLQLIGLERPHINVVPTKPYGTDPADAEEIIDKLFTDAPGLLGLYLCGGGQPELVATIAKRTAPDCIVIGHEATQTSQRYLREKVFNYIVAHDVYEVGRRALQVAFDQTGSDVVLCDLHIYVQENFPRL